MTRVSKGSLWIGSVIFLCSMAYAAEEPSADVLIQVEWEQAEEPQKLCLVEEEDCCGHSIEYFLGPENCAINPSVYPICKGGELFFRSDLLLWFAAVPYLDNRATGLAQISFANGNYQKKGENQLTALDLEWAPGFGFTVGYHSECDGWTTQLGWVRHASVLEDEPFENTFLMQVGNSKSSITDSIDDSRFIFNIFDLTAGRPRWVSKYLEIAPFSGTRATVFESKWQETVKKETPASPPGTGATTPATVVTVKRDYKYEFLAVGSLVGVRSVWHFCNGMGFFNQWSLALLYGSFDVLLSQTPSEKSTSATDFQNLHFSFSALRPGFDVATGVEWTALVSGYLVSVAGGWESHVYLEQAPLYRPVKTGLGATAEEYGEFYFEQTRNISLQGFTISLTLGF